MIETQRAINRGVVVKPDRIGLQQDGEPIDKRDLKQNRGTRNGIGFSRSNQNTGWAAGGIKRPPRSEREEHSPKKQHSQQDVAALENHRVPVVQRQEQK